MKVLHVIPSIGPLRGGPSQAVLSMVSALRRNGVDAAILTTNDNGPQILSTLSLGEWHNHTINQQTIPVLAFPRWNLSSRPLREFIVSPGVTRWLNSHAQEYDLIHLHSIFSWCTSIGMAQLRRQNIPYIVSTLGLLRVWSLSQSPARKWLFLRLLDYANLGGAVALHFTSESEKVEANLHRIGTPGFVLPIGVSDLYALPLSRSGGLSAPASGSRPVRFLFLSRIHPVKNLPVLLEALSFLNDRCRFPAWRLTIAGDGEISYVREVRQYASVLGIADQIEWIGFVSGITKQRLLQQVDWFVLPSASESFGLAVAEALMAGTPVVISPGVPMASEVQDSGAGLVAEPNPNSLSVCLEKCLVPPTESIRASARSFAQKNFEWKDIARKLTLHYAECIRG